MSRLARCQANYLDRAIPSGNVSADSGGVRVADQQYGVMVIGRI